VENIGGFGKLEIIGLDQAFLKVIPMVSTLGTAQAIIVIRFNTC